MKIFVLSADTVYDCSGAVFDTGRVLGVFLTYELAKSNIPVDTYTRKSYDYEIEEFTVDSKES